MLRLCLNLFTDWHSIISTGRLFQHLMPLLGKTARPVPDGEMFTLAILRQEYLIQVIFYGLRCSAVVRTIISQGSVS